MGGGASYLQLPGEDDNYILTQDQVKRIIGEKFNENIYRKEANNNDQITIGQLRSFLALKPRPMDVYFPPLKSLWFTPAHGGRGKSLVQLKDTVHLCEDLFLTLFKKHTLDVAKGMSIFEFRVFIAESSCGLDPAVVDSIFYDCVRYPEDVDDLEEVDTIRADLSRFASSVVKTANACDLEATGESDKGLREQLLLWVTANSSALGISDATLQRVSDPALIRSDSFFDPPLNFRALPKCWVFLDLSITGDLDCGRIVIELDNIRAPKTAFNFKCLCTGERGVGEITGAHLCFRGTTFHRVVAGMCIQGGDLEAADGFGGESVYGGEFEDEFLSLSEDQRQSHDVEGILSPAKHLDRSNTAFGRVISGIEFVQRIGSVAVDDNDMPTHKIFVLDCGVIAQSCS